MSAAIPQINAFDIQGLHRLNDKVLNPDIALTKAAQQFEGIFLKQLISSMRKVNDVFNKDSLFSSQTTSFYQGMWDDQMAIHLSDNSKGSIADLLVQQLSQTEIKLQAGLHTLPLTIKNQKQRAESNTETLEQIGNYHHHPVDPNNKEQLVEKENFVAIPVNSIAKKTTQTSTPSSTSTQEPEIFESRQEFINFMKPLALKASKILGIKPQFIIAQSALETGWGQKLIHSPQFGNSKNLFNIKNKSEWNGKTAVKVSVEFDGNKFHKKRSEFRVYDSFKHSFEDFIDFIKQSPRYQKLMETGQKTREYINAIQESGYATDPGYGKKILSILKSDIMQRNFQ